MTEYSCPEYGAGDPFVCADGGAELIHVDELVRRVGDVDRSGAEEQRRAPAVEQWDVRRIRDGRDLEAVDRVEVLRGNVRAPLDLRFAFRPLLDLLLDRRHFGDETEHQLGFTRGGDDVRFVAAPPGADI